jgi:hypothetical protein
MVFGEGKIFEIRRPERNRTANPQLRRLMLYPIELRARVHIQLSPKNTKLLKEIQRGVSYGLPGGLSGR